MDTNGDVIERYRYLPYGDMRVLEPNFSDDPDGKSDIANPYTFTGRRLDSESAMYYYRNRYYHAQLGCFVSRDPIGFAAGDANLYRYVFGSPPNDSDPSGKCPLLLAPLAGIFTGLTTAEIAALLGLGTLAGVAGVDAVSGGAISKPVVQTINDGISAASDAITPLHREAVDTAKDIITAEKELIPELEALIRENNRNPNPDPDIYHDVNKWLNNELQNVKDQQAINKEVLDALLDFIQNMPAPGGG